MKRNLPFRHLAFFTVLSLFLSVQHSAFAANPDSAQDWMDQGLKVSQTKPNSDEEAACYRRALKLDPRYASAHFNLAYVLDTQAMEQWRGRNTAWEDLDKLYEALEHYAAAAAKDPGRSSAYQNAIRIAKLLIDTPTHRPLDLHQVRLYLSRCYEALKRSDSSTRQGFTSKLDDLITGLETRLADLKGSSPDNGLVSAQEIAKALNRSFTRGHSPYQGPRVPLMIQFDLNKASIRENAKPQLRELARALRSDTTGRKKILIEGHTDSQGGMDYNQSLSERRALSVKQYLVQNFGLAKNRFVTKGYGETRPLQPNDSTQTRAMNRRVEFVNQEELDRFKSEIKSRSRSGAVDDYDVLY